MSLPWCSIFNANDFKSFTEFEDERIEIADYCNSKLNAILQCEPKVYGDKKKDSYHGKPVCWTQDSSAGDTHTARIVNIEEIKK